MKKTLLIVLFCITQVSAQQWLPSGAKWHYGLSHYGTTLYDFITLQYTGDTVINGINSKILTKSTGVCDLRPGLEYTYESNSIVYFYNSTDSLFHPFYNWNMNAGDSSFFLVENLTSDMDTLYFRVDNVVPDIINGFSMRRYFVTYRSSMTSGFNDLGISTNSEWLEGIGDLNYMFPYSYGFCDFQWAGDIRCYFDSTVALIDFDTLNDCEYIILDVKENSDHILEIYPNPVRDILLIDNYRNEIFTYKIISITGKEIDSGKTSKSIDLTKIENGIYIVEFNSNSTTARRIIIKK